MFGANSSSHQYSSNNKLSMDQGRNNLIQNHPNISNHNNPSNDLCLLYQTPIKQFDQMINNQNNNNTTPFHFDFNQHFGNLWSGGHIPNNQLWNQNINLSPSQLKKSLDKSYKLTPISISDKLKHINSHNNSDNSNNSNSNNSGSNFNNNLILNPNNEGKENSLKLNEIYDCANSLNNNNDNSKKNLYELFNNAKNELFLSDMKKRNFANNNINYTNNNCLNNRIDLIKKKNINLQISHQFMFSSPRNVKKSKKIFECSGSTVATNSSNKNSYKKRRFRKNNDQLLLLKKFYDENKTWSKSQIKEISQKINLKENKVYKWLWDQRNKEIKANKFIVKKGDNE
mgnify:CR=1 FL=1